jgi:hypothetical protein
MFQRVNYGPITNEKNRDLPDLTTREWVLMVPTVAMAIFMGVLPGIFLRPMEPSVARVIERMNTGQAPAQVRTVAEPGLGIREPRLVKSADMRVSSPEPRPPSPERAASADGARR